MLQRFGQTEEIQTVFIGTCGTFFDITLTNTHTILQYRLTASIILFSFAMPSGVVGVANSIGTQGIAMGVFTAIVITSSSLIGALLLLRLWLLAPELKKPRVFGDFGKLGGGTFLSRVGTAIQFVNFVLFMPVAIDLVADCLKGVGLSTSCSGLYTLISAGLCLCLTQVRSLPNASFAAYVTALIIAAVIIIQLVEVYRNPVEQDENSSARWFGNGEKDTSISVIRGTLGATACIWAYVPSFLTAELTSVMDTPKDMRKSLYLSASLNLLTFVLVGTLIAWAWGWDLSDPLTLSSQWINMVDGSVGSQAMNSLLLFANLTAYMLDSIPVTIMFQKVLFPEFEKSSGSFRSLIEFFLASLPSWIFAVALALTLPNLFDMLAFATALTTPWATMVFPAVCFLSFSRQRSILPTSSTYEDSLLSSKLSSEEEEEHSGRRIALIDIDDDVVNDDEVQTYEIVAAYFALTVGILSGILCLVAAVGQVAIPELRGNTGVESFC